MKNFIKRATIGLMLMATLLLGLGYYYNENLPDSFQVVHSGQFALNGQMPVTVSRNQEDSVRSNTGYNRSGSYSADIKLFGLFPIKTATVSVEERVYLEPLGVPFGIKIYTKGVLVVGMTDVSTENGTINPASEAGIKIGDVICSINGREVTTRDEVADMISKSNGKSLCFEIHRKNLNFEIEFTPVKSALDGGYKAGIWVRDSSAGIGTLTFKVPDSDIAAGLGHAICDVDTGEVLPLMSGQIVDAMVIGVDKGASGMPGELRGIFNGNGWTGDIVFNSDNGVYASLNDTLQAMEPVEMAMQQEIKTGAAEILSTIDENGAKLYKVEIEKVNYNDKSASKNIVLKVVDEELLEKTGGIVQGMSGSPILQDGRIIGAVTHVFVNDPTKGYGIFAETMYETAKQAAEAQAEEAS